MAIPAIFVSLVPLFFITMGLHSLVRSIKKAITEKKVDVLKDMVKEVFGAPQEAEDDDTQPIMIVPVIDAIKKETDDLLMRETPVQTYMRMREKFKAHV